MKQCIDSWPSDRVCKPIKEGFILQLQRRRQRWDRLLSSACCTPAHQALLRVNVQYTNQTGCPKVCNLQSTSLHIRNDLNENISSLFRSPCRLNGRKTTRSESVWEMSLCSPNRFSGQQLWEKIIFIGKSTHTLALDRLFLKKITVNIFPKMSVF